MNCTRKMCCCGSISPVKATDDMTQSVGIRDGQLFTKPNTSGSSVNPVPKTDVMTQPVGVDTDGKLFTRPRNDFDAVSASADMTQLVGKRDGFLYTKPSVSTTIEIHEDLIDYYDLIGTDTKFHYVVRDSEGFIFNDLDAYIHGLAYVNDGKIYTHISDGQGVYFGYLENIGNVWNFEEIY